MGPKGVVVPPMQEVRKYLAAGQARNALSRFAACLKEPSQAAPDKKEALVREMAAVLAAEYNRFSFKAVLEFCELIRPLISDEVYKLLLTDLRPLVERTHHWIGELEAVTRERLAREARAAVTLNDSPTAMRRGAALIGRGKSDAETDKLARYFIEALAGLVRDKDRSAKVIFDLVQSGAIKPLSFDWRGVFQAALDRANRGGMEESNREWTREWVAACAAIREFCPGKLDAGEPTPEQMQRFIGEIMAVLRAGWASGNDGDLIDAINIVKEFSPGDPPLIASAVGVEPRLFLDLGLRARLTAVRGLARIGEIEPLRAKVLALAQSPDGEGRIEMFAPMMGGLRHTDFVPFLKEAFGQTKTPRTEEAVVDALGRIANPDAVQLILDGLTQSMKSIGDKGEVRKAALIELVGAGKKPNVMAATEIKRAKMYLTALGRIGRGRDLDPAWRDAIVGEVIGAVGEHDTALSYFAASKMFASKTNELQRSYRVWGAKQILRAMLGHDTGQYQAPTSASPLGFREPMVAELARLGKEMLPEILAFAQPYAGKFSGAPPAFAEAMQKIGDERAVPILETMVRTVILQSDTAGEMYLLKEKVRDAATGELRDLDRDEMLHTLLFTLEKIGGEAGRRVLLGVADQVQAGQIISPGDNTSSFLFEMKRKYGTVGKRETSLEEPREEIPGEEVATAIKEAKGGFFAKPQKQVAALALLGRARRPESLPAVLTCLQSKEAIVYHAAATALAHFVNPLPSSKDYGAMIEGLLSEPKLLGDAALERLIEIMTKHFPKRAPYDAVFRRKVEEMITDGATAHRLNGAILIPEEPARNVDDAQETDSEESGEKKEPAMKIGGLPLTDLDRKRQYMIQRQAWIRGGKRGPAPVPPE